MTPEAYLEAVVERLLTDPLAASFQFPRQRVTSADACLRACLALADNSQLELSECGQHWPDATYGKGIDGPAGNDRGFRSDRGSSGNPPR